MHDILEEIRREVLWRPRYNMYDLLKENMEMTQKLIDEVMENARTQIEKEVEFVDIKPFSHNIISLVLMQVSSKIGNKYANVLIEEYDLEELGWSKVG